MCVIVRLRLHCFHSLLLLALLMQPRFVCVCVSGGWGGGPWQGTGPIATSRVKKNEK